MSVSAFPYGVVAASGAVDPYTGPYDATITYPTFGTMDAARTYWRSGIGTPPLDTTNNWFTTAGNQFCSVCIAAHSNTPGATGIHTDLHAMYDETGATVSDRRWEAFSSAEKNWAVESEDDSGVHGDGINGSNLYARNGTNTHGRWGTAGQSITWGLSPVNTTYVLYSANYLNWYWYNN